MLSACHNDPPMVGNPTSNTPDLKEHFINANRTIAQSEETSINEYVARRKWDMQKLPDGVRLWEYEKGCGPIDLIIILKGPHIIVLSKRIFQVARQRIVRGIPDPKHIHSKLVQTVTEPGTGDRVCR